MSLISAVDEVVWLAGARSIEASDVDLPTFRRTHESESRRDLKSGVESYSKPTLYGVRDEKKESFLP